MTSQPRSELVGHEQPLHSACVRKRGAAKRIHADVSGLLRLFCTLERAQRGGASVQAEQQGVSGVCPFVRLPTLIG